MSEQQLTLIGGHDQVRRQWGLDFPGVLSATGWQLPENLSETDWVECGRCLVRIEGAVQWWLGDWWAYGEQRKWGEGGEIAERIGSNYETLKQYGTVARAFELCARAHNLTFTHHRYAMAADVADRLEWLRRANEYEWSANELKAEIARKAALDRTAKIEMDAAALGKFAVLYGDPPWRYEHNPLGGDNRSIEKEYPTMSLEEICALPVNDIAHDDAVIFLWTTSPKLAESLQVLSAWGFECRTTMVWVKDKIGMGYHVRERHEVLLIAKRGELPPPAPETRPDSVVEAPRLEHSAKPFVFYDRIDQMYPAIRKIELFGRNCEGRDLWTFWGNQARGTNEFGT